MNDIEKAFNNIMGHRSEDKKEPEEGIEQEVHKIAKDLTTAIKRENHKKDPQDLDETMRDHLKKLEKSIEDFLNQ